MILIRKLTSNFSYLFIFVILVLLFIFIFFLISTNSSSNKDIQGFVITTLDGDSIIIKDKTSKAEHIIRLYGIDSPELEQFWGKNSKSFLNGMVINKEVAIKVKGYDKYKRILGIVYQNDKDINQIMVAKGYSWAYLYYSDTYKKEHFKAKKDKLGLWAYKAIEPYKWRKKNLKNKIQ